MMEAILQHFRKEEQPFIEMAASYVREVEDSYTPKLTGFLDPRQQFIIESIVRSARLSIAGSGAFADAERKRMLIYPDYFVPEPEDFQTKVFSVNYPSKFMTLKHKDVLGSLMSLGIARSKFGDIRLQDDVVQFAAAEEMKDYLRANFTSIGKSNVRIEEVHSVDRLIECGDVYVEELHIVSSLRLDAVVASAVNCSRQKAASYIQNEKVKVNHAVRTQTSFELNELDMLSVRGGGRFKIVSIEGRTKKDKIRLMIGKLS